MLVALIVGLLIVSLRMGRASPCNNGTLIWSSLTNTASPTLGMCHRAYDNSRTLKIWSIVSHQELIPGHCRYRCADDVPARNTCLFGKSVGVNAAGS